MVAHHANILDFALCGVLYDNKAQFDMLERRVLDY